MLCTLEEKMKRKFSETVAPKDRLEHYFISQAQREEKRVKIFSQLKDERDNKVIAAGRILIAHRTDGRNRANGALFDHRVLQEITNTRTIASWDQEDKKKAVNWLKDHVTTLPYQLRFNIETESSSEGLIHSVFIPGVSSDNYNNPNAYYPRVKYEFSLLKQAFLRGQPILAVCGGAWELWRFCHLISLNIHHKLQLIPDPKKLSIAQSKNTDNAIQFFSDPDQYEQAYNHAIEQAEEDLINDRMRFLRSVDEHNYRRMPGLSTSDGGVTHNIQMHRIQLTNEAVWLMAAMQLRNSQLQPTVNSVHWQACDEANIPRNVSISAVSIEDSELAPYRHKEEEVKWAPEENAIEAFEYNYGAPVLGIQWHAEAYFEKNESKKTEEEKKNCEQQRYILQYINSAGHTYQMRVQLVSEINVIGDQMPAWREKNLKPTQLLQRQEVHLYFQPNKFKNNRLSYFPFITKRKNFSLTHTQEAIQLARLIELPFVQSKIGDGINIFSRQSKDTCKKNLMKRSQCFFKETEIKSDIFKSVRAKPEGLP